ncbi:MAG: hypothetical protein ABSG57_07780 [Candidatus Bathyarchaeia archaeon]
MVKRLPDDERESLANEFRQIAERLRRVYSMTIPDVHKNMREILDTGVF